MSTSTTGTNLAFKPALYRQLVPSERGHSITTMLILYLFCMYQHAFGAMPKNVEDVIWWLPPDTQTVNVLQKSYTVGEFREAGDEAIKFDNLTQFFKLDFGAVGKRGLSKPILGQKVSLVVSGGRRFRAPKGLGQMKCEGVQIYQFQNDPMEAGATMMRLIMNSASHIDVIEAQQVAVFEVELERDDWTIFVTSPQPNLLIIATHRGYLAELLKRRKEKAKERALPDHLPEWRFLNTQADIWGVRHYDSTDVVDDPTSPYEGAPEWGARIPDPQAIGLVYHCRLDKTLNINIYYLSKNRDAKRLFHEYWSHPENNLIPAIEEHGEALKYSVDYFKDDRINMNEIRSFNQLCALLRTLLGYGVFV